MNFDHLSETEKNALFGLTAYPEHSDKDLSNKIGMNLSTLISSRIKLERSGYLRTVAIPMVQRLGSEILTISYSHKDTIPLRQNILEKIVKTSIPSDIVYFVIEANQSFFIKFARGYTEIRENIDQIEDIYRKNGNLSRGFNTVLFPFKISTIQNFFHYDRLMAQSIDLKKDLMPDVHQSPFQELKKLSLSVKDHKVLMGIVKYPDMPNTELAEKIGVSRITIGKRRKEFLEKGLLRIRRIPNLKKLGFELLVLMHGHFNRNLSRGLKYYVPELLDSIGPVIFAALGKDDIVTISVFDTFTRYREANNLFMSKYNEHELFASPPERILFSIQAMNEICVHDYTHLAGHLSIQGE